MYKYIKKMILSVFIFLYPYVIFAYEIPDHDQRNTVIRHTDMHYRVADYVNLADWEKRSQR